MVSAATDAAVSASISTPVLPASFTEASIFTTAFSMSSLKSTATCSMAKGWHMGIRRDVSLAAMMPATRATDNTSPLGSFLSTSRRIVSFDIVTEAQARAQRSVTGFAPTSTILALP
jgi:hypothetical protein